MTNYFSYGSNNWQQVQQRTQNKHVPKPSPAKIAGYKRIFQGHSKNWQNSGKANIIPAPNSIVFGSLYRLNDADLQKLGSYEHGYNLITIKVFDLYKKKYTEAYTFAVKSSEQYTLPSKEYQAAIQKNLMDVGLDLKANNI